MANLNGVSPIFNYKKLLLFGKNRINKMERKFKSTDKGFESQVTVNCYYVYLRMVATSATQDLPNNLNHIIVKNPIKMTV